MAYTDREDQREYGRLHYQGNKDRYQAVQLIQRPKQIADRKAKVREYLSTHPCIDCGEADIVVLDFDHVNAAAKSYNISQMVRSRYSWKRIQEEIDKCVVRCANCHRRRTAIQFGWL